MDYSWLFQFSGKQWCSRCRNAMPSSKSELCVVCKNKYCPSCFGTCGLCIDCSTARTFNRPDELDLSLMKAVADSLQSVVKRLRAGSIPCSDYDVGDLAKLCRSLVEEQLPAQPEPKGYPPPLKTEWAGAWYAGPLPIPDEEIYECVREYGFNDFTKDFVCAPTFGAVGVLSTVTMQFPEVADVIVGFGTALKAGMSFVARTVRARSYRNGYLAIRALEEGNVVQFVAEHPEFSSELYSKFTQIAGEAQDEANAQNRDARNAAAQNLAELRQLLSPWFGSD